MSAVIDLVEFLRARLDEDEAVARSANGPRWASGDGNISEGGLYALEGDGEDGWSIGWFELGTANEAEDSGRQLPRWPKMKRLAYENSVHAARHDPARVLAEVAAKRRTLVRCEEGMLSGLPSLIHFAKQTAWEMALQFTDHPKFDPAWRVSD